MKYQTISMKQFFSYERRDLLCSHRNGDLFTCEDNMLFSHVKISCFRAKAHLVFHWCLYNKNSYLWYDQSNYLNQTVLNWTQQKIEIRWLYVMWMHFLCFLCTLFVFAYWRGPNINWSILAGRCAFNLTEFFTAISF